VNSRARARAGRLRPAALGACAALTLIGVGATSTEAQIVGPSLARAGTKAKVRYGDPLKLSGRVAAAGVVRLEYLPAGGEWRSVGETLAQNGTYSFRLRPIRSGAFRAVTTEGISSTRSVTVVARLGGRASRHVRVGSPVRVRGRLAPGFGGRRIRLQVATRGHWRTVDRTLTGRDGRYRAVWRASGSGRYRVRVKFAGDGRNAAVSRRIRGFVYVYRPSAASWYGPGLYGNGTACGGVLGTGTLGVAHKWLPCGTRVTIRYHGRSVTVPVIDRGPFVGNREWDLTGATKTRVGFGSTGTVWVAH
jgi:rare lipoprotein A